MGKQNISCIYLEGTSNLNNGTFSFDKDRFGKIQNITEGICYNKKENRGENKTDKQVLIFRGGRLTSMNGKKVLVVDDQYGIRVLIREVFARDDMEIIPAANGMEALEKMKKVNPDLILLDMKMPGMDGLEFLRQLRSMNCSSKVIMMTAYGELDMVDEASKLGALAHFTKPFDIEELRTEVIRQLVS